MAAEKRDPVGKVMVVGAGIAGVQAALDLANAGFYVHLVEKKSAIGGVMAQLDKTFPTNDCSMCIISPKLVECGRHLNIEILTLSEVKAISGEPGQLQGHRGEGAPLHRPGQVHRLRRLHRGLPGAGARRIQPGAEPKARPFTASIPRPFPPPSPSRSSTGPPASGPARPISAPRATSSSSRSTNIPEALALIMDRLPLPGTIGRICPHPCETDCRRQEVDEPIAICNLKRFVADQVDWDALPVPEIPHRSETVAIVGAGPSRVELRLPPGPEGLSRR